MYKVNFLLYMPKIDAGFGTICPSPQGLAQKLPTAIFAVWPSHTANRPKKL